MLAAEAIDLHYGASQALRGVSVRAELGQVTCVLGRNGVGKTSLLRAVVGHQEISAGTIKLEGAEISALPPTGGRRGVSLRAPRAAESSAASRWRRTCRHR